MELTKIHLSSPEVELMLNPEVILTKNRVLQKITGLLEGVLQEQLEIVRKKGLDGSDPFIVSPKISRGENYLGLPWLILDYPRASARKDICFIRSMFWWGNFFSSTLHLSGAYALQHRQQLINNFSSFEHAYISISTDPWVHHFEETSYKAIRSMNEPDFRNTLLGAEHIKIAAKWPLSQWEQASSILVEHWRLLAGCGGLIA